MKLGPRGCLGSFQVHLSVESPLVAAFYDRMLRTLPNISEPWNLGYFTPTEGDSRQNLNSIGPDAVGFHSAPGLWDEAWHLESGALEHEASADDLPFPSANELFSKHPGELPASGMNIGAAAVSFVRGEPLSAQQGAEGHLL